MSHSFSHQPYSPSYMYSRRSASPVHNPLDMVPRSLRVSPPLLRAAPSSCRSTSTSPRHLPHGRRPSISLPPLVQPRPSRPHTFDLNEHYSTRTCSSSEPEDNTLKPIHITPPPTVSSSSAGADDAPHKPTSRPSTADRPKLPSVLEILPFIGAPPPRSGARPSTYPARSRSSELPSPPPTAPACQWPDFRTFASQVGTGTSRGSSTVFEFSPSLGGLSPPLNLPFSVQDGATYTFTRPSSSHSAWDQPGGHHTTQTIYVLNQPAPATPSRTQQACNNCRGRKVKCVRMDGKMKGEVTGPCEKCNKDGKQCIYEKGNQTRKRRRARATKVSEPSSESDYDEGPSPAKSRRRSIDDDDDYDFPARSPHESGPSSSSRHAVTSTSTYPTPTPTLSV